MRCTKSLLVVLGSLALALAVVPASRDAEPKPQADAASGRIAVTDATGTEVTMPQPAEKVASLYLAEAETLALFDMAPAAILEGTYGTLDDEVLELLFGTTAPGGVAWKDVPTFKSSDGPDVEQILATEPDLIWGDSKVRQQLGDAVGDIPVYAQRQKGWRTVLEEVTNLGKLTGNEEQATKAVDDFEAWVEEAKSKLPEGEKPSVTIVSGDAKEFFLYTTANVTIDLFGEFFDVSAWKPPSDVFPNGVSSASLERLAAVDPDHIFVMDGYGTNLDEVRNPERTVQKRFGRSDLWNGLTAVREGEVTVVPGWVWDNRGIRSLRSAAETALGQVYPDAFPKADYLP
jgi:ABC-type Fe3+-hydroxamate transport system substrate-binding protein